MRQLARIVTINKLDKHPNADRLQIAQVGLWNIVTAIDTHKIGGQAIFFEIDSMLPLSDERFAFLAGRKDYVVNGITYARLKTIRLRGVLSQGLLVPADLFEKEIAEFQKEDNTLSLQEILGVIKYEPPEDNFGGSNRVKNTPGDTRPFPVFIPKTDQERIQNFVYEYNAIVDKFNTNDPSQFEYFEVTYKLDGSSITMYSAFNKLGVCSRNLEINMPYDWSDWPTRESHFIKAAIDSGIMFKLAMHYSATGRSIALQGELCGPGIQSNFEGLTKHEIFIYDVYDIDAGQYMLPDERREFLVDLGIQQVPVHSYNIWLPTPIEAILEMADGPSGLNGQFREGLVFKSMERDFSFKAISNSYLEKTGK